MNTKDAEKQIQQMIAFIQQEAREKAEEIEVKTENEFMAEKLSLQTQASIHIREEFEAKSKDRLTEKKIARSKKISAAAFEVMRERDAKLKELKKETLAKLASVSKNKQYPELVKFLITQGLTNMMENDVKVRCRKEDATVVQGQLAAASKLYVDQIKAKSGVTLQCNVTLDTEEYLAPGPSADRAGKTCAGGVLLMARGGKIKCNNTIEARLDLAFDNNLPVMRGMLFGVRAPPANAWKEGDDAGGHH